MKYELAIFKPGFGLRNLSPFCLKIEMLLAYLGLEYETFTVENPRKAPKGKLPFIRIGSETIADSEIIISRINNDTNGQVFAGLSEKQKSLGLGYVRLTEEHLYWILVASRWLDESWQGHAINGLFGFVPQPFRWLIGKFAIYSVGKSYSMQGLGRHTIEEQMEFARRDLIALEQCLIGQNYILGEKVSVYDFSVASILAGAFDNRPATWLTEIANEFEVLKDYTNRVQNEVNVYAAK